MKGIKEYQLIDVQRMWVRSMIAFSVALVCLIAIAGCGGSKSSGSSLRASGNRFPQGRATGMFSIAWPRNRSRAIPPNANRIVFFITSQDNSISPSVYFFDRPDTNTNKSTTYRVEIPVGKKVLFSAEAWQVTDSLLRKEWTAPADQSNGTTRDAFPVDISTPGFADLTPSVDRVLLGAGNDGQAHNVSGPGDVVNVSISINQCALPDPATTDVTATINQIIGDAFPSIIAVNMIRDQDGKALTNLNAANFVVTEDGKPTVITDVRTVGQAAQNISVSLILDRSGSMAGQPTTDLNTAANSFFSLLQPGDSGEVINFDDTVVVSQPFTTDISALGAGINAYAGGKDTALYDAIIQGINDTANQGGRMAVIAMTDGGQNAGQVTDVNVVSALAQSKNVPLFTVGLGDVVDTPLKSLAQDTGGLYFNAPGSADLANLYKTVANQLQAQWQISFISPNPVRANVKRHVNITLHYGAFTKDFAMDYTM